MLLPKLQKYIVQPLQNYTDKGQLNNSNHTKWQKNFNIDVAIKDKIWSPKPYL